VNCVTVFRPHSPTVELHDSTPQKTGSIQQSKLLQLTHALPALNDERAQSHHGVIHESVT